MYPKCAHSFKKWCLTNPQYIEMYYNFYKLYQVKLFDVTLRDGLQALSKYEQENYTTNDKLNLYHNIYFNYQPKNIEVGSISSEKVFPIFKDTIEIFNKVDNYQKSIHPLKKDNRQNVYILIPNQKKMEIVINNTNINHFSFITSVSNSFQIKNTKMTLTESDRDISNMLYDLEWNTHRTIPPVVKLYVSCINHCPIEGKIDNDFIIHRLLKLNNNMNVDLICLSDTCGTLMDEDFEYIVDTCSYFGLKTNKIGLHLHIKKEREKIAEKIIHKALDRNITNFDVSFLDTGGCSITMDKTNLLPNMSYELYYKFLCNYIKNKS
jgi:isopropylmalate/homocitrate/citramalate synthase